MIAVSDDNFIIIAMDNNQRGQRKKQQREGTSNNFIVVTHSMAIKPLIVTSRKKITGTIVKLIPRNIVEYTSLTSNFPPPVG